MIGKSLRERHTLGLLDPDRAIAMLTSMLDVHARHLIDIRARDARMIACLFVDADRASVRMCRALGFRLKLGATGVFGLLGADAARLFTDVPEDLCGWLETPCGARETKVLFVAGGLALLSVETHDGVTRVKGA